MKFFYTTVVLILSTLLSTYAQTPSWQWGRRGGSNAYNEDESIKGIATDPNGNVYILSQVRYSSGGSATLDVASNPVVGKGAIDVMLSSFTCTGTYRWSKVFGGALASDYPANLQTDTLGGVYFTGRFNNWNSTVQLASDTTLTTQSGRSLYLIKYDTAGNYKWVARPQSDTTGVGDYSTSFGLQVDGGGNVYWLAHLLPNYYGNGNYQVNSFSFNVLKYNKNGVFQGGIPLDISANAYPVYYQDIFFTRNSINGKFVIAGYSQYSGSGSLSFGNTSITKGMFIGAFSPSGTSLWTKQNTSTSYGGFFGRPTLDSAGNVYISGSAVIGDQFAGSAPYTNSYPNVSSTNVALSLDSSGNLRWAKNSSNASAVSISHGAYSNGQFVLAGSFTSKVKWNGLNDSVTKVTGNGDLRMYTTRFNAATGQPLGMDTLTSVNLTNNFVDGAYADKKGNVYFAGQMDKGIVIAGTTLLAAGSTSTDFFLAKYGYANCNCVVPTASIAQTSYNNAARSVNFQYTGTTAGIDSIVFTWGNGQRLRLTGNYNGVITRYYGTDTGTYNVCVTAYTNGCGNNTACTVVRFTPLGVGQLSTGNGANLQLAPNPAAGATEVSYILQGNSGSLEVYDLAGRLLSTKALRQKAGTETMVLTEFAAGVYVVVLREEGRVMQQQRLVIAK